MEKQRNFELQDWYAVFRPSGHFSIGQVVEMVTEGINSARALNVRKLLVDITNLSGFEPPGIVLRYFLIQEWSRAAGGIVCLALVARPEIVDSERVESRKIASAVAAEIGFTADIFTTEADALSWLASVK